MQQNQCVVDDVGQGFEALAAVLGVSLSTVRRAFPSLLARGLPARRVGRLVVFSQTAVAAWLAQGDGYYLPPPTPTPASTPSTPSSTAPAPAPAKRGRGRPRKNPLPSTPAGEA